MPEGERFELVDGQLLEKPMGAEADWVGMRLMSRVSAFVEDGALGLTFGSETGYQCFPDDSSKVRKPDGSFVRKGRLPANRPPKGHIRVAPDLAIEVISPHDLYYEVEQKVDDYRAAGFRLIWVINPDNRTVKVYAEGREGCQELTESDELDGGEVLPGFRCRVVELFPPAE
jgi:Uma2 family endonuclease